MCGLATGVASVVISVFLTLGVPSTTSAKQPEAERNVIDVQVRLTWAHASPGPIDGRSGKNTRSALEAFQRMRGLPVTGKADKATIAALRKDAATPTLVDYEISAGDVNGPFVDDIPASLQDMADLTRLSYSTPLEALAEKFRMDEGLLRRLNHGKDFGRIGTVIRVANVSEGKLEAKITRLEVDKADQTVRAYDDDGSLAAVYPATIGSDDTPSPTGTFKIKTVAKNPTYVYDPKKLNFKGVDAKDKFGIAPGPNNPVGLVWIGLGDGYGIHGSPEPSRIRRQSSHGCVRLTNWDALELADAVKTGVQVTFVDGSTGASEVAGSRR